MRHFGDVFDDVENNKNDIDNEADSPSFQKGALVESINCEPKESEKTSEVTRDAAETAGLLRT